MKENLMWSETFKGSFKNYVSGEGESGLEIVGKWIRANTRGGNSENFTKRIRADGRGGLTKNSRYVVFE